MGNLKENSKLVLKVVAGISVTAFFFLYPKAKNLWADFWWSVGMHKRFIFLVIAAIVGYPWLSQHMIDLLSRTPQPSPWVVALVLAASLLLAAIAAFCYTLFSFLSILATLLQVAPSMALSSSPQTARRPSSVGRTTQAPPLGSVNANTEGAFYGYDEEHQAVIEQAQKAARDRKISDADMEDFMEKFAYGAKSDDGGHP
jgi:hypothetical protein